MNVFRPKLFPFSRVTALRNRVMSVWPREISIITVRGHFQWQFRVMQTTERKRGRERKRANRCVYITLQSQNDTQVSIYANRNVVTRSRIRFALCEPLKMTRHESLNISFYFRNEMVFFIVESVYESFNLYLGMFFLKEIEDWIDFSRRSKVWGDIGSLVLVVKKKVLEFYFLRF